MDWYNLIWFPLAILNTLLLVGLLCTISSQLKLDYFNGDCQLIVYLSFANLPWRIGPPILSMLFHLQSLESSYGLLPSFTS